MIVVSLLGGLGNQLFQFAAARSLAHRHGARVKLDTYVLDQCQHRSYALHHFNLNAEKATMRDVFRVDVVEGLLRLCRSISPRAYSLAYSTWSRAGRIRYASRYYAIKSDDQLPPLLVNRVASQRVFHFDEEFNHLPDNVALVGSWISYKYFDHIRQLLLKELSVNSQMLGKNLALAQQISSTESVSVHVRRTDKVGNPEHLSTDIGYVNKAIEMMSGMLTCPVFYVFSDDIEWCKSNLKHYNAIFVDWNDDSHAYEDLRLMRYCKHNIIAESSFSWWGAYLNNNEGKKVITPPAERWIQREKFICHDILKPEWIVVDA